MLAPPYTLCVLLFNPTSVDRFLAITKKTRIWSSLTDRQLWPIHPYICNNKWFYFFSLNSFSEKVLKICYSSFMVTGVILNLAIIVIFLSKEVSTIQTLIKKSKIISCLSQVMLTTQNILILNLCAANLLMIFFNIPLTISDVTEIYWTLESVFIIIQ